MRKPEVVLNLLRRHIFQFFSIVYCKELFKVSLKCSIFSQRPSDVQNAYLDCKCSLEISKMKHNLKKGQITKHDRIKLKMQQTLQIKNYEKSILLYKQMTKSYAPYANYFVENQLVRNLFIDSLLN